MGRTAAAGWKQMVSLCTTAWSHCGVCSQGWPFRGGPEEHLGTPEAADPQSISKCCSQRGGLCSCLSAAMGLGYSGSLWASSRRVGDLSSFCCSLGFHTGGAHSLQELTGRLAAFLRGGGLWFHLLLRFSQKSLCCLSPPLHTHTVCRAGWLILHLFPDVQGTQMYDEDARGVVHQVNVCVLFM